MPELGQFLKEKRESSGLSLKRLSSITGISDSELLKIENGTRKKPGWEHLCKIAKALNLQIKDLFDFSEDELSREEVKAMIDKTLEKFEKEDLEIAYKLIGILENKINQK